MSYNIITVNPERSYPTGRKQRYRAEWEKIPQFRGWLIPSDEDIYLAFCKACKTHIQAHKKDISRHSTCKKHINNMKSFFVTEEYSDSYVLDTSDFEDKVIVTDLEEPDATFFFKETSSKKFKKIKTEKSDVVPRTVPPTPPIIVEKCSKWCCQGFEGPPVFEDSYSIFGKFVGNELRLIQDSFLKQKLKMKINTILYRACIGKYDADDYENLRDFQNDYLIPQLADPNDDQMASFGKYIATELRCVKNKIGMQTAKTKIISILFKHSDDSSRNGNNNDDENILSDISL